MFQTQEEKLNPVNFLTPVQTIPKSKEEKKLADIETQLNEQLELNDQFKAQIIFLNDLNAELQQESQWARMRLETLYNLYSSVQSPGCEAIRMNYTNSEKLVVTPKDGKTWTDVEKAKGKFTVTSSKKGQYQLHISGHYVSAKSYPVSCRFRLSVKCDKLENVTLYYPNELGTSRLLYDLQNQEMNFAGLADFCQGENVIQLQIILDNGEYKWNPDGGEIAVLLK
jgi:hypothetical protein